jgi:hypothetical protein
LEKWYLWHESFCCEDITTNDKTLSRHGAWRKYQFISVGQRLLSLKQCGTLDFT